MSGVPRDRRFAPNHPGVARAVPVASVALALCAISCAPEPTEPASEPERPDAASVPAHPAFGPEPIESTGADTRLDLIRPDDPSAFDCLVELGLRDGEFYDKVTDRLEFPANTAFFDARFTDGARVEIRIHPELGGPDEARFEAERIARALGVLPGPLRADVQRVGLLAGDAAAQADGGGEGIHLYRENVERRIATDRFEETLFHEAVPPRRSLPTGRSNAGADRSCRRGNRRPRRGRHSGASSASSS